MKRLMLLLSGLILLLGVARLGLISARPVAAEPVWSPGCGGGSCHNSGGGGLTIYDEDTMADPDESATGAPDHGILPVFQVVQGRSRALRLTASGLESGDTYAVELKRFDSSGVVSGQTLDYSPDCAWAYWGQPGNHFTDPEIAHIWGSGPTLFDFELLAGADAGEDYYDLVCAIAGKRGSDGSLFYSQEHFYLQVRGTDIFADGFDSGDSSRWSIAVGGS